MRSRVKWILLSLVVVSLCLVGWTGYEQKRNGKSAAPAWEYKIVNGVTEAQLNELGAQGWELTAVAIGNGQASHYLKRAK